MDLSAQPVVQPPSLLEVVSESGMSNLASTVPPGTIASLYAEIDRVLNMPQPEIQKMWLDYHKEQQEELQQWNVRQAPGEKTEPEDKPGQQETECGREKRATPFRPYIWVCEDYIEIFLENVGFYADPIKGGGALSAVFWSFDEPKRVVGAHLPLSAPLPPDVLSIIYSYDDTYYRNYSLSPVPDSAEKEPTEAQADQKAGSVQSPVPDLPPCVEDDRARIPPHFTD